MDNLLFNLQVSSEEKKNCLPIAHRLICLAESARRNGIVFLENEISELEENSYLKMGVALLSSGVSADIIEKSFLYSFITNKSTGEELLKRLLISSAILAIYNQNGNYAVAHILASLLGEEYLLELLKNTSIIMNSEEFIDTYTFYISESLDFEKKMLNLSNCDLSKLLMLIDCSSLAIAFQGCSKSFINFIKVGISYNRFIQICEAFSFFQHEKKTILEHQALILHKLKQLKDNNI